MDTYAREVAKKAADDIDAFKAKYGQMLDDILAKYQPSKAQDGEDGDKQQPYVEEPAAAPQPEPGNEPQPQPQEQPEAVEQPQANTA